MLRFPRACLAAAMFTMAAPAFAILPQQGMWSIGSELDGKPGRGVQIDRQGGRTLIISYFGYRADGSSMFLQASGALKDGRTFNGELTEFKNGRPLGGSQQSGAVARVVGPVSIEFETATTGLITLPGEQPQRFSRFQFEDLTVRINGGFEGQVVPSNFVVTPVPVYLSVTTGTNELRISELIRNPDGTTTSCTLKGDLEFAGDGFASNGVAFCDRPHASWPDTRIGYRITNLKVDEYGSFSARLRYGGGNVRYYTATCTDVVSDFPSRCSPQKYGLDDNDLTEYPIQAAPRP
ncbi:MAG: hypothetical protein EOO32_05900 [Comamonadaceae bacterium]|nr:MAG: hypothetical protein EOO32_05900 [Comamonadaceae bacterium]